MKQTVVGALFVALFILGCGGDAQQTPGQVTSSNSNAGVAMKFNYSQDVAMLKKHVEVVELTGASGEAIAVVAQYQGRVMTSTFDANMGVGIGWINHDVVAKNQIQPHITVFGGEDRFWIGPEGGQFSVFFKKGDEQDLTAWQTPALIDSEPYDLLSKTKSEAVFTKSASITNYSGTVFSVGIKRTVSLLNQETLEKSLKTELPDSVKMVAYETRNELTNDGKSAWEKDSGLLSIWILSMYKHSPTTTVVAPYIGGDQKGVIINDDYFGKVPTDRLQTKGNFLIFKADGQYRSKIGLPPGAARDVLGSYDPVSKILTIVQYNLPKTVLHGYVNSKWIKHQDDPYSGDIVNSYNDGPPEPGMKPLGPFYELETSSPALALGPGESYTHVHRTIHLTGSHEALNKISKDVMGIDLDKAIFTKN